MAKQLRNPKHSEPDEIDGHECADLPSDPEKAMPEESEAGPDQVGNDTNAAVPEAPTAQENATAESETEAAPASEKSRAGRIEIQPGTVLKERFLLLKEIGKGGLSIVYKARDMVAAKAGLADPNVAIKIIRAAPDVDPDVIALMHREARRLRDLVHPNIVRVFDMDREGDIHFMVMELLEGQPLSKVLRNAPDHRLQSAQLHRLIEDLSGALTYAHNNGIIHADLKPGNVFVQKTGVAKLIDFNIAYPIARPLKTREEDTIVILARFGAVTPAYASPQRLKGAEPCEPDDVFSLAVITYLALTGSRPFGKKNALEAREEGLVAAQPADLSRLRWRALRQGLSLSDSGRTQTAALFAQSFCRPNPVSVLRDFIHRLITGQPYQPSAGK
ncbi:serine/threonine-protein kinase [Roseibium sp. HPY-6]|uniref:serine/threonine-protein kinase n=1 Tax=Roseibium sp. HPY-6 TaxID=3229852 RepID=UPI00338FC04D